MAGIYVKDNGTWKLPKSIWVNSGGWRVCQNVYVKSNGAWREMIRSVTLSSSQGNFNLWNYVGSPTAPLSLIFNISSNVEIFSSNTSGNRTTALTVGNFPTGSTVIINNNGYISGGGGFGGRGATYDNDNHFLPAQNGYNGGDGVVKGSSNNFDCTIVNTGTIAGGGGGGGGGQRREVCPPYPLNIYDNGCRTVSGNNGGQGAGITGASRTQGGSPMTQPPYGRPGTPNSATGGFGGSLGEPGIVNEAPGLLQKVGGAGGKAIGSGIEIAVSGTIIGAVG